MLKDGERCLHAHFCANSVTNWYQLTKGPDDQQTRVQLVSMIEHCPSGALSYEIDGELVEPDLPQAVSPVPDGPLFVSGGVEIERADDEPMEVRNRVTLCRCGASSNKPLCDGTHAEIGFQA